MDDKTVTLVGKGDGWDKFPKDAKHIWAVNSGLIDIQKHATMAFHLHDEWSDVDYDEIMGIVKKRKLPLLVCEPMDKEFGITTAMVYPLKEIVEKLSGTPYFTNSVSYMIAYALYKGFTKIELYGFPMNTLLEYKEQKPSIEFWIGVATGMGIDIELHDKSTILFLLEDQNRLYGYDRTYEEILEQVYNIKPKKEK